MDIFTNYEMEQINLFEALREAGKLNIAKKTYSAELPERIKGFTGDKTWADFSAFIQRETGKTNLVMYKASKYRGYMNPIPEYFRHSYDVPGGAYMSSVSEGATILEDGSTAILAVRHAGRNSLKSILVYATGMGVCYESEVELSLFEHNYLSQTDEAYTIKGVTVSKWKKAKLHAHKLVTVLNRDETEEILSRVNPYGSAFLKEFSLDSYNEVYPVDLLIAPQLEQLDKAGYKIAKEMRCELQGYEDNVTFEQFNRLCQPGKNMKEIFKTSKAVYTTLKNCEKLSTWDIFRKMDKQGKLTAENVQRCYEGGYSEKELNEASVILNFMWKEKDTEKPLFTWDTLQRYLERIDMYEAIDRTDGLMLLKDYLAMCRQLEMKPRIDGDSLRREHDVTARTLRQKKDEVRAAKMVGACTDNKKYDYAERSFFGRCIRSYDDLIDEATQQHNCVAGYADDIIAKKSYIFVVRETSNPDKSLATVEISPKGDIRQKLLAYNRPIRNKALTDFIDRLAKNFRDVKNSKNSVSVEKIA